MTIDEKERRRSGRSRRSRTSAAETPYSRKCCYSILLVGSVVCNLLQLAGMHAVLPDGLVRARDRGGTTVPSAARPPTPPRPPTSIEQPVPRQMREPAAASGAMPKAVQPQPAAQQPVPWMDEAHPLARPTTMQPKAPAPSRHPTYRLAFTVPWVGKSFPSWMPYFLSSCRRSGFLVDWLIFHEDAQLPGAEEVPPNVIFHNLGKEGLARLFGTMIAAALGAAANAPASKLIQLFKLAFSEFSYIVTEYKPTHGVVFANYLQAYSHWSYTDIDILSGDFAQHIELAELRDFDIFTYHFGDVFRLYLRGQFCAHRNTPRINQLWVGCPHLASGLVHELEAKWKIIQRLAAEGKRGRTRFISAEGCYSAVVAATPELRVKFIAKAYADWSDDPEFYVVDGALRKCADQGVWRAGARGQTCNPFGPRLAPHSVQLEGAQRPLGPQLPLRLHNNCSRWVEQRYRVCANLSEDTSADFNVMMHRGVWTAQRYVNMQPAASLEGAFLHLQRWKAYYKRMRYGSNQMPRLRGRRIFRLTTRGFTPLDLDFSDELGANTSVCVPPPPPPLVAATAATAAQARRPRSSGGKSLQEIVDVAEFEAEVLRLV